MLETAPPATTSEARAAGNRVLAVTVTAVLLLAGVLSITAAGAFEREPAPEPSRPLPFLSDAQHPQASAWEGGDLGGGALRLATSNENGMVAAIRGGTGWHDYTVRTRLRWIAGSSVSVHVLEASPTDYVACVFDGGTARIEETVGGVTRTLASREGPSYRGRAFDVAVGVHGRHVSFAADGVGLVEAETSRASGTAGIGVWDPEWGRASAEADYVRVEPYVAAAAAFGPVPEGAPVHEDIDRGE